MRLWRHNAGGAVLRAAKISSVGKQTSGNLSAATEDGVGHIIPESLMLRYRPVIGDYLIEHNDRRRQIMRGVDFEASYIPQEG
jgi:hypothetical protein